MVIHVIVGFKDGFIQIEVKTNEDGKEDCDVHEK
jgi:hypothetical protein